MRPPHRANPQPQQPELEQMTNLSEFSGIENCLKMATPSTQSAEVEQKKIIRRRARGKKKLKKKRFFKNFREVPPGSISLI